MQEIVFVTGNQSKADQLGKYLIHPIRHKKIELTEIQSLSLKEVVRHKAMEAYRHAKQPVIVDDTSLTITALGRLPGPFIKYFLEEIGHEGICRLVDNFKNRAAIAEIGIGFCDGQTTEFFSGVINGRIAEQPHGDQGFGWDSVFIPDGYDQTRAQLAGEAYDQTSPRRIVSEKVAAFLEEYDGIEK